MLCVLAVAAVFVIMIVLLIRFKNITAIGIMFIALIYLTVKMSEMILVKAKQGLLRSI